MAKLDEITINVTFTGSDVQQTLEDNPSVMRAVWDACRGASHAYIKVHVAPRFNDMTPLEWNMTVASPRGRSTFTILQQSPAGAVRIISG